MKEKKSNFFQSHSRSPTGHDANRSLTGHGANRSLAGGHGANDNNLCNGPDKQILQSYNGREIYIYCHRYKQMR